MEEGIASTRDTEFLIAIARQYGEIVTTDGLATLDFGCGAGGIVGALRERGLAVRGCDFAAALDPQADLDAIETNPYRLPYPDGSFDLVVSTSVFEHAQNTQTCFEEIHRVLRSGGIAVHQFPGKWFLPTEPHIFVPLVSWFWPRVPKVWLSLWALLGVRNEYQQGLPWQEVARLNADFVRNGLCYRTSGEHQRLSDRVFGNHEWAMSAYIEHHPGRAPALLRRLPFRRLGGRVLRELRFALLVQRKA